MKAEQKAKEKAEKDLEKEKAAAQNGPVSAKKAGDSELNEAEISPNEYFKLRSAAVEELKKRPETHPYPHKFHVTISLENFIEKFQNTIKDGETLDGIVSVAGRVHSIRGSGAKLIFYDVRGEGVKIQVMANAREYINEDEFTVDNGKIRRGDIIGVEGLPGKTKKGELSIIPKKVKFTLWPHEFECYSFVLYSIVLDYIADTMFAHDANIALRIEG